MLCRRPERSRCRRPFSLLCKCALSQLGEEWLVCFVLWGRCLYGPFSSIPSTSECPHRPPNPFLQTGPRCVIALFACNPRDIRCGWSHRADLSSAAGLLSDRTRRASAFERPLLNHRSSRTRRQLSHSHRLSPGILAGGNSNEIACSHQAP
jgi:hypothetical protein